MELLQRHFLLIRVFLGEILLAIIGFTFYTRRPALDGSLRFRLRLPNMNVAQRRQ